MTCNFHVGQKVVCIEDDFADMRTPVSHPRKGNVYTVRTLEVEPNGDAYIRLVEVVNPTRRYREGHGEVSWDVDAFRPVVTRKTDISIFKAMLTPSKKRVEA